MTGQGLRVILEMVFPADYLPNIDKLSTLHILNDTEITEYNNKK